MQASEYSSEREVTTRRKIAWWLARWSWLIDSGPIKEDMAVRKIRWQPSGSLTARRCTCRIDQTVPMGLSLEQVTHWHPCPLAQEGG